MPKGHSRYHQRAGKTPEKRLDFYSRPASNGCLEWIASKDARGYGRLRFHGRLWPAHRLAWVVHRGGIPAGADVCHRCDNPSCINPSHLWLGTRRDNMHDMAEKGRNRQPRGEAHNKAKLTAKAVKEIAASSESGPVLGARYGVSRHTINSIKRGETWSHTTQQGEVQCK